MRVWHDIRFNYDAHGRLVRKDAGYRATTLLRWNNEHQIITSNTERLGVSTQSCLYHYDALGHQTGKTYHFGTTWFAWDGMLTVQEQRGGQCGQCTSTVYADPNNYKPLARIEHDKAEQTIAPNQIFYFHTNANGAPEELTSSALGRVV